MPYIYLIISISTEVIGSAFLKSSEGFSKFIPSLGTIISFGICFYFLSKTMQHLPL
ncbi:DMT family transporter, partial [Staphylococcus aureus]